MIQFVEGIRGDRNIPSRPTATGIRGNSPLIPQANIPRFNKNIRLVPLDRFCCDRLMVKVLPLICTLVGFGRVLSGITCTCRECGPRPPSRNNKALTQLKIDPE
ncbi:hypothetical protein [Oscillatoria acuminata]|uniref:hypothetical protein n=1 Tax=Oscillatoria acuminata TaxID=118323 RepID=UPI0012EA734D|nr:hypothetical protein [Oscillatoria acuminata]